MIETNLNGQTPDITEVNIKRLKEIFPDVFSEGKVDFEKLQQVLGNYIETSKERYNFTWNGKSKALRLSQTPSTGTLRPCKEESKDWDTTENLYIEGDNLEVLKLLQKSYHGKIKMIYIDPPYNTGNDFVYPDKFTDSIENYKKITLQIDEEGNPFSTNSEANGRYHTDWLNLMYPRLRLARNLLTQDGVIIISIDEHEIENLTKICKEIYGELNHLGTLVWRKKYTGGKGTSTFVDYHEYILVFAKSIVDIGEISMSRPDEEKDKFELEDEYIKERGKYYIRPLKSNLDPRPTLVYPIELPDGTSITTQWICARDTYDQLYQEGRILIKQKNNGEYQVYKKFYELDGEGQVKIPSLIDFTSNNDAKEELKKLFNIIQTRDLPFSTPKPTKLLGFFVENFTGQDDIIFDFFSGSSSTADAVMQTVLKDGKRRKFIMVQIPEQTKKDSDAYNKGLVNICEIGKERIRRAGDKIKKEVGLLAENLDIGFKVFKLDYSNIKKWQPDYENLELSLQDYISNFVDGRTELDVAYEIMLKYGLDLTYPVDEYVIKDKKVYSIGFGMLIICLDNELTTDIAQGIIELVNELSPESSRVVFKDNGFKTDSNKTNIKEILKCGGIEEFITI